jgi:hypothetical protein
VRAYAEVTDADGGQVTPLVAVVVVLTVMVVLLLGQLGARAVERAQAQTAADAAALAGAADGRDAAAEVARRNGGTLVEWQDGGIFADVVVTVGAARATARAERVHERREVTS